MITTFNRSINTYNTSYDVITTIQNLSDLNNKLFCTFTDLEGLDSLIEDIKSQYEIIYNKLFITRKSFIPRNNKFVEIDISAYHPSLAARLVGYSFPIVTGKLNLLNP